MPLSSVLSISWEQNMSFFSLGGVFVEHVQSKKHFTIVSNYLITTKSKPCLIYINLFVLWTHKLCEIIYFLLWAKLFITFMYTYKNIFFRCRCICSSHKIIYLCVTKCLQMHNHLFTLYQNFFGRYLFSIIYHIQTNIHVV